MPTTLRTRPGTWQGLGLSLNDALSDNVLSDKPLVVAGDLLRLGGRAPAPVLLRLLERHGYEDAEQRLLDALCDAPDAFSFYRV
jgi:hypothetical protein